MKLRNLALLLTITAGLASMGAQAATNGSLRFAGQVNAGTCNLAAGDENRTITLPTIKISDLDSSPHAGRFDFDISADCESDIRNVIFLFAGTPDTGNRLLFANTGTSKGTALWLLSREPDATLPADGTDAQRSRTVPTSAGKALLRLSAAYHKNGVAITQGTLASAATVSITYN